MMLLQVLAFILFWGFSLGWVNDYDREFYFNCPADQYISRVASIHDNHYEDRRWLFLCRPESGALGSCSNSNRPVNEWDAPLNYNCPNNGVLVGVGSEHNNYFEDRRFWFRCCQFAGSEKPVYDCHWTGDVNDYDGYMEYNVPYGYAITGLQSVHDNYYEDRRWKFVVCRIA